MKSFYQIYIKFLIKLHNYLYSQISKISLRINNNIHPKHKIINYHEFFIKNIEKEANILDVGCGIGALTYDLAKKAQKVIGIDNDKNSIEFAKKRFNKKNIKYIHANVLNYKFNENFDFIILSNVLEHIKNRYKFLNKLKQLSANFLIRVPMVDRSWLVLYKKNLGLDYRLDKTHYIEYTFNSFKKEINDSGLKIISYIIQFGEIWAKIEKQ